MRRNRSRFPSLRTPLTMAALLVLLAGLSSAMGVRPVESGGWRIPNATVDAAVKRVNTTKGTDIKVKYVPDGVNDGKLVISQVPGAGRFIARTGQTQSPPVETVGIELHPDKIRQIAPEVDQYPELWEEMLVLILLHEWSHIQTGQGGEGVPDTPANSGPTTPDDCDHLKVLVKDGERACQKVQDMAGSTAAGETDTSRCKKSTAFCKLHKWLQDRANTPANAAANCPGVTLYPNPADPTGPGLVIPPCLNCPNPGENCPTHYTH